MASHPEIIVNGFIKTGIAAALDGKRDEDDSADEDENEDDSEDEFIDDFYSDN